MSVEIASPVAGLMGRRIRVSGHVQGVGFRPFVKRLADELGLCGSVGNDADGVCIEVDGDADQIDDFRRRLANEAPAGSRIEAMRIETCDLRKRTGFMIAATIAANARRARVPVDRAMCDECRDEIRDPQDRRHGYAFTSCVACGPRYTLLARMPYARLATSMSRFPLCDACNGEFADTSDRRHHAEVIACPACGPRVLAYDFRTELRHEADNAIRHAAEALVRGDIVALKGLGGFQLLVRADDDIAVARLRDRKHRPTKSLAVMVRSLEEAANLACLTAAEQTLLASPENPIVLTDRRTECNLSAFIAPHSRQIGLMLPTTPLHALLLDRLSFPLVATSCNRGEEPILADDASDAELAALADVVLTHDRPILRRLDDSVFRVVDGQPAAIRLARGYAPIPLQNLERWIERLPQRPPAMLAVGAQQKNAVAIWTGAQAILGPHVGDLDTPRTLAVWRRHIAELAELYGTDLRAVVADIHPDYAASRWAEEAGLPIERVAHHHAHAAAAMVEHDLLDNQVLALTWDGTGLSPAGELWGGECLRATVRDSERIATIRPIRLPGGEAAIRQPWRIALALLHDTFGDASHASWRDVSSKEIAVAVQLLQRGVHCPPTTSIGRLFDGIASLILGISHVTYEGEAAARLEAIADPTTIDAYPVVATLIDGVLTLDGRSIVCAVIADQGLPAAVRAARFHNTLAEWARRVAERCSENDVVLTGGCFQNALLTSRVAATLATIGKRVHRPEMIPVNDGGLAAGQLAIALARGG